MLVWEEEVDEVEATGHNARDLGETCGTTPRSTFSWSAWQRSATLPRDKPASESHGRKDQELPARCRCGHGQWSRRRTGAFRHDAL